ncbi:MAG: AroM family protein [Alcanivoracaceae bacterium]|nr:AroM family protein [Alcanivoracaceae bacterium]
MLYSRMSKDVADFVRSNLQTQAQINISGALDDLSDEQLRNIAADPISTGVPVELDDGSWLYVSHDEIDKIARARIDTMQAQGCNTVMMCCTLPWHSLESLKNVVCPSKVLEANAIALLPTGGVLGVVQPDAVTKDEEIKHWLSLGCEVVSTTVSPEESMDALSAGIQSLVEQKVDLIVLDCLAFTREHWQLVRKTSNKPVILPMSLLGKVLDEAYGEI